MISSSIEIVHILLPLAPFPRTDLLRMESSKVDRILIGAVGAGSTDIDVLVGVLAPLKIHPVRVVVGAFIFQMFNDTRPITERVAARAIHRIKNTRHAGFAVAGPLAIGSQATRCAFAVMITTPWAFLLSCFNILAALRAT